MVPCQLGGGLIWMTDIVRGRLRGGSIFMDICLIMFPAGTDSRRCLFLAMSQRDKSVDILPDRVVLTIDLGVYTFRCECVCTIVSPLMWDPIIDQDLRGCDPP